MAGVHCLARWSGAAAERPWTVGVEEDVMLLDAARSSVANRVDDVLAVASPDLASCVSVGTHAYVVELKPAPSVTVDAAGARAGRAAAAQPRYREPVVRAALTQPAVQ